MPNETVPESRPSLWSKARVLELLVVLLIGLGLALTLQPRNEITTISPTINGPVNAPVTIQVGVERRTAVDAEARVER